MSAFPDPIEVSEIGPFGLSNIMYTQYRGRFVGSTASGDFNVPYEITTPADQTQANGVCIFEPRHRFSGAVARDVVFGPDVLLVIFGGGYVPIDYLAEGTGNATLETSEPDPPSIIVSFFGGASHATVEHRRAGRGDLEILRKFAIALRGQNPFIRRVSQLYSIGFSETGNIVHEIYQPFGHQLFDLTVACTTTYNRAYSPPVNIRGQKPIIIFGSEREFVPELAQHVARNANFPQHRWYTIAGGSHIPDTPLTRRLYTDPPPPTPPGGLTPVPVAGTTPINWVPFLRALLVAGDEWVRNGIQPPPSATLRMSSQDPTRLDRDYMDNALGGIRHPALETHEATFVASVPRGNWPFFGGYGNEWRVQHFGGLDRYFRTFAREVESLVAARLLLRDDADRLLTQAQLNRANTFTRNYAMGLFV